MKFNTCIILAAIFICSCASVPQETVKLSEAIDADLMALNTEQNKLANLYFNKLESDINSFVDDVYVPYVIHTVLKKELDHFKNNEGGTLFDAIENAADSLSKKGADLALSEMTDFQEAANRAISQKRNELLKPIQDQRKKVTDNIEISFENIERASTTLTSYLKSITKLKESQETALSKIGMKNADKYITSELIKVSDFVDEALKTGRKIDIKSDDALENIEKLSNSIKQLTQQTN